MRRGEGTPPYNLGDESERQFYNTKRKKSSSFLPDLDFGGAQTYLKERNTEPLPLEQVGAEVRSIQTPKASGYGASPSGGGVSP